MEIFGDSGYSYKDDSKTSINLLLQDMTKRKIKVIGLYFDDYRIIDVDFRGYGLYPMSIRNCIFKNCNFESSQLSHTFIADSKFINCDFSKSWAKKLSVYDSTFFNCKFRGIKGMRSEWSNSKFINCDFTGSNFRHSEFYSSEIDNCKFSRSDFYRSIFRIPTFKNTNTKQKAFAGVFSN